MTRIESAGPEVTRRLAARLGRLLAPGDVIALRGELGAGKTCFVQGLARGLGIAPRDISSPTFTIMRECRGRLALYHIDLYRIGDASELGELGLESYLSGDGVCAVEWMDRFPALMPPERIDVELRIQGAKTRELLFEGQGARGRELLKKWLANR